MTFKSLNLRLWLTIAVAVTPLLIFVLVDYHERRTRAIEEIHAELAHGLGDARRGVDFAQGRIALALQIMSRADEMQTFDAQACSALSRRLLASLGDAVNIGAVLPDGSVPCSAQPVPAKVNMSDRAWFRSALQGGRILPSEFVIDRITGDPVIIFAYPLTSPTGEVVTVLFASLAMHWFDRLIDNLDLPANWEVSLISADGHVYASGTEPARWRADAGSTDIFVRVAAAASTESGMVHFIGHDGTPRLYGVSMLGFASDNAFLAIGAPLEQSMAALEDRFQLYLGVAASLALLSILMARFYIYRSIDTWASRVYDAVTRIADGSLDARIGYRSGVGELDELSRGIDVMAGEIEKRDAELRRLSTAIEQSPESIVITDTEARILYVNQAFLRTTGYALEEILGRNPRILNTGLTPKSTYKDMWSKLLHGEVWRGEFHNARKDGSPFIEEATIAPIKNAEGVVTHYVAVKEDITQRKRSEALLHRLAYYDGLTELPNRALLRDRLAQAFHSSGRHDSYGMLMLLDIDRFQQFNDTMGHAVGDRLLLAVSARLRVSVREADTVARNGDDDFAILIEHLGASEAEALARAEQITRKVGRALQAPYILGETEHDQHYVTLSIGVSLFHGKTNALDTLLKQAEVALYRAKREGRNNVRFFNPAMQAAIDAHARMETRMHEAIEADAFQLHYQPQFDRDGRLTGAEALLRWPLGDGSMVSPAEFIPLAEDTGQIVPLGHWVLRTACAQLARWQADERTRKLTLAVNISARQFHQPDFIDSVQQAVSAAGIDPTGLKFELTETTILTDLEDAVVRMHQLDELGIRCALDDFGTGYSSLAYLKRLPFGQLKIDQSFVRDMNRDKGSEAIVLAILSMCRAFELEPVAEGVETPAQHAFLLQHGCELHQGYLLGKPAPIEEWNVFLARL